MGHEDKKQDPPIILSPMSAARAQILKMIAVKTFIVAEIDSRWYVAQNVTLPDIFCNKRLISIRTIWCLNQHWWYVHDQHASMVWSLHSILSKFDQHLSPNSPSSAFANPPAYLGWPNMWTYFDADTYYDSYADGDNLKLLSQIFSSCDGYNDDDTHYDANAEKLNTTYNHADT